MKLRFMPMLASAIALTLTAAPLAVNAQAQTIKSPSEPLLLAEGPGKGAWEQLNLTQEQRDRLARIREQTRAQIDALLTPEQRQQLESLRQNNQNQGQGRRGGLRALNLTEEQRTQVRQIMESSKTQSQAVLTPEQQAQLQQLRQQWRQQRNQQRNQQGNQ